MTTDPTTGPIDERKLLVTRRRFFGLAAGGAGALASTGGVLGRAALGGLFAGESARGAGLGSTTASLGANFASGTHFPAKAKRVIYMHMEGAPSHLDLFDYKPGLRQRFDEDLPESIRDGQRLTGMTSGQTRFPVAPSLFRFSRYPNRQDGAWVSEAMPHTGGVARELCFIRSMHTDAINHEPAITFFQTGTQQPGRPSFGAWCSYGLGNANENLPAFVVLISQGFGNTQALSERFWGSGFLDGIHAGCKIRSGANPVLHLKDPAGVSRIDRRRFLDLVAALNEKEAERTLDPEVATRVAQYEMAYRMQMSVPELTDFSNESEETLAMYGPEVKKPGTFAANCLLARRLAERGVRFVQLFMRGWDAHSNLPSELRLQSDAVDQPQAALIRDLKQRGLLDDTIVLWSGEFGRTVYSQGTLTEENYGRDHHPRAFTTWVAGGGFQPGIVHGATDDYGYNIVRDPVSVHDLHATLLNQLGFDHEQLGYRTEGRDMRLTDVFGRVVPELIT
ncbi:MAG: DUF1501 domain-containing protein [Planctomycetota bacterium]|nr:DUF1501 domain-containing protein [Planctomycetota bacterium]